MWNGKGEIIGSPAISGDGHYVAFSIRQNGQSLLYVMQSDGTNTRLVNGSLDLMGDPAWSPDGRSITAAAIDNGVPHLYQIPLDGNPPRVFAKEYSLDPAWSPDGQYVIYSGPDIGTTFPVKAANTNGAAHPLPYLNLTRGARHMAFLPGERKVVVLRGEIKHKNLWIVDLATGTERQLTNLAPDFDVSDFDVSPDGHEIVLERVQQRSNIVLMDLPR